MLISKTEKQARSRWNLRALGQLQPLRKNPTSVPLKLGSWPRPFPLQPPRAALPVPQAQQTYWNNSGWGFPLPWAFRSLLASNLFARAWGDELSFDLSV